jgi:hypothetical protein
MSIDLMGAKSNAEELAQLVEIARPDGCILVVVADSFGY